MNENQKKSVFDLPKMVTDNPKGNFEVMLNLVYGKDGWSYIRYSEDGTDGMPITDFCFKKLCPEFGCSAFADQTMTDEEKDELLSGCVFDNCPVATVYAALSGYGHLRDRLRKHEDAMSNRVLTLEEVAKSEVMWYDDRLRTRAQVVILGWGRCEPDFTKLVDRCGDEFYRKNASYNDFWRCWLRKPTEAERRETPWAGDSHE
jgi:hypothetical protein